MTQMHNQRILPWQQTLWSRLWTSVQRRHLPHALLFVGPAGVGKRHFANNFMQALCCEKNDQSGGACDVCHGCRMVKVGSHPDCMVIAPDTSNQAIRVDTIREITEFAAHSAIIGKYKIIIIDSASSMNIHAANALLKVLEEPPAHTVFILSCPLGGHLPATVRSRCQRILFPLPEEAVARDWLSKQYPAENAAELLTLAQGAPLKACEWLESGLFTLQKDFYNDWMQVRQSPNKLIDISTKWSSKQIQEKISTKLLLDWLFFWLRDQLRDQAVQGRVHARWLDFLQCWQQIYAAVTAVPQLNRQLILEDLMLSGIKTCS